MATRVSLVTLGDEAAESLVARAEQSKMGYFEFLDAVLEEEVETPRGPWEQQRISHGHPEAR
jgi:hypothetical protein